MTGHVLFIPFKSDINEALIYYMPSVKRQEERFLFTG